MRMVCNDIAAQCCNDCCVAQTVWYSMLCSIALGVKVVVFLLCLAITDVFLAQFGNVKLPESGLFLGT